MTYPHDTGNVQPITWWEAIPVGATLVEVDKMSGIAVFEADNDGQTETGRWTVDLFTDEVTDHLVAEAQPVTLDTAVDELRAAIHAIADAWESGDLAAAVRHAASLA